MIAALGMLLAVALVVLLARRRPRPVVAAAALVGLCAALSTAASFQPWAALWLVPFVALVGIGWRDHLLWAGAEAVHAVAMFGYLDYLVDPAHGLAARLVRRRAAAAAGRGGLARPRGLGARELGGCRRGRYPVEVALSARLWKTPPAMSAAMHTLLSRRDRDRHRPKEAG